MKLDRITSNPNRMNGQPCIRNLRLTVRRVIELLATYPDRAELHQEFPELEDEDIRQALIFASSYLDDRIIENLGLKPRRFTTALLLNINTFTKYMLKCETWKKPILTDFTPHQNKSRYCGALWAV
jgi:uncharacterized protein (DUF433 family)|nr:DUF433 domain-containing protein [Microcystis sp. M113S1]